MVFGLTLLCDIKYHGRSIVRVFYEIVVPQIDSMRTHGDRLIKNKIELIENIAIFHL